MRLLEMPCGIIVNFYPKFATIKRYFYDTDHREILTSDNYFGTDSNPHGLDARAFAEETGALENCAWNTS